MICNRPVTDHVIGFANEYTVNDKTFNGMDLYYCGVIGLVITGLLIWITEYYTGTSYRPVKSVALSSTTGHGTNVIQGLAVSMEATAIPALIIVAGILITNSIAGLFGIAIAIAIPKSPAIEFVIRIPATIINAGIAVASIETAKPWITFVPWPVVDDKATDLTGL